MAASNNPYLKKSKSQTFSPIGEAAVQYAEELAWHAFPMRPGGTTSYKTIATHGSPWGETGDPDQVRADFARWPRANVGIATGRKSGIWVLDGDIRKGGLELIKRLEEQNGPLPETLRARSQTGGPHYYFNQLPGITIPSTSDQLATGVDVRGDGGMVFAPPSVRKYGQYTWVNWGTPIADAPQWLIDRVKSQARPQVNNLNASMFWDPLPDDELAACVRAIKNPAKYGRTEWTNVGMGIWRATDGSDFGLSLFDEWSQKWPCGYSEAETKKKWTELTSSPPDRISVGTLIYLANQDTPGWRDRAEDDAWKKFCRKIRRRGGES